MPFEVFDVTQANLEKEMKVATKIQAVISHNVANASTPDFEPLTFDKILNKAIKRKGESVNLEQEMKDLALNSIKYSAMTKLLASKFNILRTVATQGRR